MGSNGWGKLSVLLLAGAALVGCNNTPEKNKTIVKPADPQPGYVQPNKTGFPNGGTPVGTQPGSVPTFPQAGMPTNQNSIQPAQGQFQPGLNSQFNQGPPPSGIGADPGRFQPLPTNTGSNLPPSSFSQPPNPNSSPFGQPAPSVPSTFGTGGRVNQSTGTPDPLLSPPPAGFRTN